MRRLTARDFETQGFAAPMIEICVYCDDPSISPAELRRAVAALQTQIDLDFAPAWDRCARLRIVDAPPASDDSWLLHVKAGASPSGNLGDHFVGENGRPVGYVYPEKTRATLVDGAPTPWTVTASHELLEMLVNPYLATAAYVNVLPPGGGYMPRIFVMLEVVDPCQYDWCEIDGVIVGDFVFPNWFHAGDLAPGPFDHCGAITAPRTLSCTRRGEGGCMWAFDPQGAENALWIKKRPPVKPASPVRPAAPPLIASADAPVAKASRRRQRKAKPAIELADAAASPRPRRGKKEA